MGGFRSCSSICSRHNPLQSLQHTLSASLLTCFPAHSPIHHSQTPQTQTSPPSQFSSLQYFHPHDTTPSSQNSDPDPVTHTQSNVPQPRSASVIRDLDSRDATVSVKRNSRSRKYESWVQREKRKGNCVCRAAGSAVLGSRCTFPSQDTFGCVTLDGGTTQGLVGPC